MTSNPHSAVEVDGGAATTVATDHRDRRLEQLLDRYGVTAELVKVRLTQLDWDGTDTAQIRAAKVQAEVVESYRAALEGGAIFPAGLARRGEFGLVIIGGIHRAYAHQAAGMKEIALYILPDGLSEADLYLLSVEDNTSHGLRLTLAEQIEHGLRMIDQHNLSVAEAARRTGLNRGYLDRAVAAQGATQIAHRLGLHKHWRNLKATAQWQLAMAAGGNERVLGEAIRVAGETGMSVSQVTEMAGNIRRAHKGSTASALLAIRDYEPFAQPDSDPDWGLLPTAGGPKASLIHTVRHHCRIIVAIDPDRAAASLPAGDRVITLDLLKRTAQHIATIAAGINRAAAAPRKG